jgi:osmotically-inducible protein OsmY
MTQIIVDEFRLDPANFAVTVSAGVVTLVGSVEREQIALELVARIRHMDGVVVVRDRLAVGQLVR